jgi:putative salt-induced outer membrane protein
MLKLLGLTAAALAALSPAMASADDAPAPPPPQHQWLGKGQFGFLESKGNSDAESVNGSIDLTRYDEAFKNALYVGGLYGKSAGIVSAQRLEAREQTNYEISPKTFAFGGFRYEHDLFDGFQYQASLTAGFGYKFLDSNDNKLAAQLGAGYRRIRPEMILKDPATGAVISRTPEEATGEAIATAGIDYLHKFSPTTTVTNKFLIEHGSTNTLAHDEIALAVKMSTRLALSVGYAVTDNSNPPAPLRKVDTLTTVNLVFAF